MERAGAEMRVTAEEFARDIERVTVAARHEPVRITDDGREGLILVAAAEYDRLREREARAVRVGELPADRVRAMLATDLGHLPDDPDEDSAWAF